MSDDNARAMKMVIDDMGAAARQAKLKRYAPKPKLGEEAGESHAPEAESNENEMPTVDELTRMLDSGHQ